MNKAERLWNLRDGVLAWLYELRVEQFTRPGVAKQAGPGHIIGMRSTLS